MNTPVFYHANRTHRRPSRWGAWRALLRFERATTAWKALTWGIAAVELLDGSSYLIRGNAAAYGPSYYMLQQAPSGLHVYGAVLMLMGGFLIYASSMPRRKFARRVLGLHYVVFLWLCAAIVASWFLTREFAPGTFTKWLFIAWTSLILRARTPTPGDFRDLE